MKIAYFVNVRMPTERAHGVQVTQMCRAFALSGHEVTLIVPKRVNSIGQSVWDFYGMERLFRIIYVPIVDFIVWDKWLGNLAYWFETLWFGLAARRVVASLNPDVVYTREAQLAPFLPPSSFKIFEAHDFPKSHPSFYRRLWRRFDRIVALTAGLRDRFISFGLPAERLVVAHDAVEPEMFSSQEPRGEARRALGLPTGGFLAIYIGGLYPHKGVDDLLAAAERLDPGTRVVIAGGGGRLEELRAQAAERQLTNVSLPGQIPHADVARWLRAADVAVLPNRGGSDYDERYTSPMKLFEYLAAGLPVVTSDLPTVREVLGPDDAAFVPPGDPEALATRLNGLSRNPVEIMRLEKASRRLAPLYTWKARAESVVSGITALPGAVTSIPWLRIGLLALTIRLIYVIWFPQPILEGGDGTLYLALADKIRGLNHDPSLPKYYQYLYPWMLAGIRSILGDSLIWIRVVQALISSATVALVSWAGGVFASRRAGVAAGLLMAMSAPFVIETGVIYTETTYAFFLTLALVLTVVAWGQRKPWAWLAAGVAFVLAGLTRELAFYLLPLVAAIAAWKVRYFKGLALLVIPSMLVVGALALHNISISANVPQGYVPIVAKRYDKAVFEPDFRRFALASDRIIMYPEGTLRFFLQPNRLTVISGGIPLKSALLSGDWPMFWDAWPEAAAKAQLYYAQWLIVALAAMGVVRGSMRPGVKAVFLTAIGFSMVTIVVRSVGHGSGFDAYEPLARYRFPTEPLILVLAAAGIERWSRIRMSEPKP